MEKWCSSVTDRSFLFLTGISNRAWSTATVFVETNNQDKTTVKVRVTSNESDIVHVNRISNVIFGQGYNRKDSNIVHIIRISSVSIGQGNMSTDSGILHVNSTVSVRINEGTGMSSRAWNTATVCSKIAGADSSFFATANPALPPRKEQSMRHQADAQTRRH